jgi:hypothetical protein
MFPPTLAIQVFAFGIGRNSTSLAPNPSPIFFSMQTDVRTGGTSWMADSTFDEPRRTSRFGYQNIKRMMANRVECQFNRNKQTNKQTNKPKYWENGSILLSD